MTKPSTPESAAAADGPWARIARQAAQRPDAPALRFEGVTLRYRDLAGLVERRRGELAELGVRAGHALGWLAHNHPDAIATLLACERLGARCVPLNWRLAAAELAGIAADAELQWLLADEAHRALAAEVAARAGLPLPATATHEPGDLMLVYTSGTTGRPKGAVHTAAGMAANIDAAVDAQGFDERTVALAVLPLFHVGGLCIQVLPVLASGGSVILHARFDPGAWLRSVEQERPTTSLLVPAVMRALVEHGHWGDADLSSLAFVNSGSQIVPPALIERFHARGVPVAQVYGSTETGPVSIVLPPSLARGHVGHCGIPAKGVQVRLAPDGEILLRAPNLMRAYHRSAQASFDAEGWFHTGDLALRHADGCHEVVGRSKELIISGGENIHPAEIENLLADDADVAECAVAALPDARWGEVPVLAVVLRPGCALDEAALRGRFDARLARFKHPRRIVVVSQLPRTALGKVNRSLLASQLAAGAAAAGPC